MIIGTNRWYRTSEGRTVYIFANWVCCSECYSMAGIMFQEGSPPRGNIVHYSIAGRLSDIGPPRLSDIVAEIEQPRWGYPISAQLGHKRPFKEEAR